MFAKGLAAFGRAIARRRHTLRRHPWLRPTLLAINVILAVVGVFLSPVIGLLVALIFIAMNELLTPLAPDRVFVALEGILSFSGDLQRRNFRPLPLDPNVLAKHKQLSDYSCIPMSVEFVLKLLGKLAPDDFSLQNAWGNRRDGNFAEFDGRTFDGIRFTQRYPQSSHPRGDSFPLGDLFNTIEDELKIPAQRYVIVSLAVPSLSHPGESDYHNYVIFNRLPNGEFEAVTKGRTPERINDIKERVQNMKGTDIFTYELVAP
jgi:hypothetical protein